MLLIAAAAGPVGKACAQPSQLREIFAPPSGLWLLPGAGFGTHGQFYGPSSPDANWVVDQWNTPENLPPFHDNETENASLGVRFNPASHSYILEQNGSALSCDRTYESGVRDVHEFDVFVSPNNGNRPEYRQALQETNTYLGSLRHLQHSITLDPLLVAPIDTECPLTRVTFLTSVTLADPGAKQTVFYELRLGLMQVRGGVLENRMPRPAWFARGLDPRTGHRGYFGFSDSITSFSEAPAEVARTYAMDLLPRLIEIIHAGAPDGLDQDLSHWSVRGTYHGDIVWGHMHVRARWQGFSLADD